MEYKEVKLSPVFSELERERIRGRILGAGRELFAAQGLRKTSLEELTRPAGIHKTSFYSFFGSKEELYLELLALEGPGVEKRVWKAARSAGGSREAIERFLRAVIDELETNPLVRRLVTHPEELRMVAAKVTPEHLELKTRRSILPVVEFVRERQREGQIMGRDPEVIGGLIRAVTMLTLHKEDIGERIYPEVMDLAIELIAAGLTTAEEPVAENPNERTEART